MSQYLRQIQCATLSYSVLCGLLIRTENGRMFVVLFVVLFSVSLTADGAYCHGKVGAIYDIYSVTLWSFSLQDNNSSFECHSVILMAHACLENCYCNKIPL